MLVTGIAERILLAQDPNYKTFSVRSVASLLWLSYFYCTSLRYLSLPGIFLVILFEQLKSLNFSFFHLLLWPQACLWTLVLGGTMQLLNSLKLVHYEHPTHRDPLLHLWHNLLAKFDGQASASQKQRVSTGKNAGEAELVSTLE